MDADFRTNKVPGANML